MPEPDLLRIFARPIHDAGMRYLVTGSVGSIFFSEPRLTLDIDFAVAFSAAEVRQLPELFPQPAFYAPPTEILAVENARECRGHFNIIHVTSGLKADFYPSRSDPFFSWAWGSRQVAQYSHGEIFYAPPEYVIVWKVAYYNEGSGEKHVRDVGRMLEVSHSEIDRDLLEGELERRGLMETYRKMLR